MKLNSVSFQLPSSASLFCLAVLFNNQTKPNQNQNPQQTFLNSQQPFHIHINIPSILCVCSSSSFIHHSSITMVKFSNSLIGILNLVTLVLSIPILVAGVWLSKQANTECERWLERPVIALGVFLLLVSLAGLIGACCRVSWLLWVYLLVMFLLIVILFAFTIFAFVVTNKGAGEAVSGKGYKEYRLGDYSNWLQKRVNNDKTWNRIRSCLQSGKLCSEFETRYLNDTVEKFYTENLSAIQVFFPSLFIHSFLWVVIKIWPCMCFVLDWVLIIYDILVCPMMGLLQIWFWFLKVFTFGFGWGWVWLEIER